MERPIWTLRRCGPVLTGLLWVPVAALSPPVAAQGETAPVELERVEITGSAIRRIPAESALPVLRLGPADISRSGAQTVPDLLQALPAMQGFTHSSESVGGERGGGFAGISIHGLGEARTLVLVNGRRVATWGGQSLTGTGTAVDLNSLPLVAVERVEILTDGASAVYGADAIGGVVNLILKRGLKGQELSASLNRPKGGVGQSRQFTLSSGFGNADDGGGEGLVALSLERQAAIQATDRRFARSGVVPFTRDGKRYVFSNLSWYSTGANFEAYNDLGTDDLADDFYLGGQLQLLRNGACPARHVEVDGFCKYDYVQALEILPESQRESLSLAWATPLGQGHKLSADVLASRFTLRSRIAATTQDLWVPESSPLYSRYLSGPTALDPAVPAGTSFYGWWRAADLGPRATEDQTRALHGSLALTGQLADWEYDAAVTRSISSTTQRHLSGWIRQNELLAAIDNGSFDPLLGAGQQSPDGLASMKAMQYQGVFKTERSVLDAAEWRLQRGLDAWGFKGLRLAVGADLRRERVESDPSEIAQGIGNSMAGDIAAMKPWDVSRTVWGGFGELLLPLTPALEVGASLRHDQYSDFGASDNAKVSLRFQPAPEWMLRGSLGSGFRAPSVPQIHASRQYYGVTAGTPNCPTEALTALQAQDPTVVCRIDGSALDVIGAGNRDLKPERSVQWSLGGRLEPGKGLSVGADLWGVEVRDRIGQLSESTVLGDPQAYLKNFTTYDDVVSGQRFVSLYLPNENLGRERYLGIDVDARVRWQSFGWLWNAQLMATHMLDYQYQLTRGGQWQSNLGVYRDGGVTFRNILRLTLAATAGGFEHSLTWRHRSGYTDVACTADDCGQVLELNADGSLGNVVDMVGRRVASYSTFDWMTRWSQRASSDAGWQVSLGVINLFDRDPPFTMKLDGGHQIGYDNRYTDARGRTLFTRVSLRF